MTKKFQSQNGQASISSFSMINISKKSCKLFFEGSFPITSSNSYALTDRGTTKAD